MEIKVEILYKRRDKLMGMFVVSDFSKASKEKVKEYRKWLNKQKKNQAKVSIKKDSSTS